MNFVYFDPLIVNCYYAVFATVTVLLNVLLIFLMRYRSPHIVRSLKAMLINICVVQILIALTAAFLQGRMMANSSTNAILSEGPASMFGPRTCVISYNILNALISYLELLIVHTMFYRYRMLKTREMNKAELILSFVMVAIWPIMLVVLPQVASQRFDVIMEEGIRAHPNYNLERYGKFGGFQSTDLIHAACSLMSFSIVTASPILILYLKRLTLRTLNSFQQYTESIAENSKMFLKAFTVQAMVPICCFVTTALLGIFATVSESEIALIEYLLLAIGVLPCVIDPLIAIYFVPSYRAWVAKKLCSRSNLTKIGTRSTTDSTRRRTAFKAEAAGAPVLVT